MSTQAPPTLNQEQFQAAVKAANGRFSQLREKHPSLKGYLVLCIPGNQTGIGSSVSEINGYLPALLEDGAAKDAFRKHLESPPPKDASERVKKAWDEQYRELAAELHYDSGARVEMRFGNLDYELIWQLQSDELVDRELTPQTRASIRIVLGTLAAFSP